MVVSALNVEGVAINKPESDAPLVVDSDRMLSLPVTIKCVKTIAERNSQVVETRRQIHVLELSHGTLDDIRRKAFRPSRGVEHLSAPVRKRLDKRESVLCHVTGDKQILWRSA